MSKAKHKQKFESADGRAGFVVCTGGKTCSERGGAKLYRTLKKRLTKASACPIGQSKCLNYCRFGAVIIAPGGDVLKGVEKSDIKSIVKRYLNDKRPPKRLR